MMKLLNHFNSDYEAGTENVKTECVHCGSNSLSMDVEAPHQYQCFKCKTTGNAFTYIRKWYDNLPVMTKVQATNLCSLKKGITLSILHPKTGVGIKFWNECYWIPVYNQKNHLVAVHKYVPSTNITYSSPKPVNLTILGLQNLTKSDTIWVAEGHFDYFTLLPKMTDTGYDLLGTCGSYFVSSLLTVLKDKHVVLLYDNDDAGIAGIDYVARHLKSNSIPIRSLSYLDWNKITLPTGTLTKGFDVRDLNTFVTN